MWMGIFKQTNIPLLLLIPNDNRGKLCVIRTKNEVYRALAMVAHVCDRKFYSIDLCCADADVYYYDSNFVC